MYNRDPRFTAIPIPEGATANALDMRDIDHLEDITIANTQQLLDPDGTSKHEVVFIGGFLAYKHQNGHAEDEADDDVVSSEFIQEWDQGG